MADLHLVYLIGIFVVCAGVIGVAGSKLAGLCDVLADRTGWGEAITGALLLGAATSLPGLVTTAAAAMAGRGEFALSNAVGGIAGQTAFLAIADIFNRRANLEHQAASLPNILSTAVLMFLLGSVLMASESPEFTVWAIHPATLVLVAAYLFGLRLTQHAKRNPQWKPLHTHLTVHDEPDEEPNDDSPLRTLFFRFGVLALVLGGAGWLVAQSGMALAEKTGLSDTIVGGFFAAIATSLPELVTAIAAVRRGALTLAVGDIVGGNAFDVMFAVAADCFYREGSIYHAMTDNSRLMTSLGIVMSAVLLAGLVSREKRGIANIGFESFVILVLYVGGFVLLAAQG